MNLKNGIAQSVDRKASNYKNHTSGSEDPTPYLTPDPSPNACSVMQFQIHSNNLWTAIRFALKVAFPVFAAGFYFFEKGSINVSLSIAVVGMIAMIYSFLQAKRSTAFLRYLKIKGDCVVTTAVLKSTIFRRTVPGEVIAHWIIGTLGFLNLAFLVWISFHSLKAFFLEVVIFELLETLPRLSILSLRLVLT